LRNAQNQQQTSLWKSVLMRLNQVCHSLPALFIRSLRFIIRENKKIKAHKGFDFLSYLLYSERRLMQQQVFQIEETLKGLLRLCNSKSKSCI
jgi:hypothetical protein